MSVWTNLLSLAVSFFLRFFAFILLIFNPMSLHHLSYCLQLHAEYRITGFEQTPACLNVAFNLEPD